MKHKMKDVTFLILVRLDSIQRLENLMAVVDLLLKKNDTNIFIREASLFKNGILNKVLNRKIRYEFVIDKDPVLYKTLHFNQMIKAVDTPYIAIWDADVVPDNNAVLEAVTKLREGYDVVYPYNGICLNVSSIIKIMFLQKKDIRFLVRNINKMDKLYPDLLVGGAIFVNRDRYVKAGMENEGHYGWGNDDYDRYYRFLGLKYKIYRVDVPLFHLIHPRWENSSYHSFLGTKLSKMLNFQTESSSSVEIEKRIVKSQFYKDD